MAIFMVKKLIISFFLLSIKSSFCQVQVQDAVQIVAQAALCFDNRPVMNGCLRSLGLNTIGTTNTNTAATNNNSPTGNSNGPNGPNGSNGLTGMCGPPCFGQMTLMMQCLDGIMSNFQGYSSGLMTGVQAIFQMSCGVGNTGTGTSTGTGTGANTGTGTGTGANTGTGTGTNAGTGTGTGTRTGTGTGIITGTGTGTNTGTGTGTNTGAGTGTNTGTGTNVGTGQTAAINGSSHVASNGSENIKITSNGIGNITTKLGFSFISLFLLPIYLL